MSISLSIFIRELKLEEALKINDVGISLSIFIRELKHVYYNMDDRISISLSIFIRELKRLKIYLVVSKILCKPPSSGRIEITDDGGFNYVKKRK